jgi:hypothetical protein
MELFGVGPLEFLLVLVLALVILGPQDMVGTARKIGQWIYRVVRSPTWRAIISTTQDLRELPQKIVREAGLEEAMNEVKDTANQVKTELNATTSEISSEMRAAGDAVSSEMGTAVTTVRNDAIEPAPLPVSFPSFSVWPENTLAQHDSSEPPSVAEIVRTSSDPYKTQLGFFADALLIGSKPTFDLDHITRPVEPPPPPLPAPELFASALGSFFEPIVAQTGRSEYESGPAMAYSGLQPAATGSQAEVRSSVEGSANQEIVDISTHEMPPLDEDATVTEPSPADWMQGVPAGLSPTDSITPALEERMRQMTQALERLDATKAGEENPNNTESSA